MNTAKPLNKTRFGPVKDVDGDMETREALGEVLSSIKVRDLSRKVRVTVSIVVDREGIPDRDVQVKTVTVRTLRAWYKEMTGAPFDKSAFQVNCSEAKKDRTETAILSFGRKIDSGYTQPIR